MRRAPYGPVVAALVLVLLAALVAAIAIGAVAIPPDRVIATLLGAGDPAETAIVVSLRLPRVLGAALVGAALAVAGVLLQGLLRNPLADPYVLGTSAGASVGAVLGLTLAGALGFFVVPALAFAGAILSIVVVWRLARVGAETPIVTLLLAGVVFSAFAGAIVTFVLVSHDRLQLRLASVLAWLMGGVSVVTWTQLAVSAALVVIALALAMAVVWRLDAFALGEETAATLGIDVEASKRGVVAIAALLTAAAVSIAGLVAFVGLIAPHATRLIVGPAHLRLVPAAALAGAAFVVLADLAARVVVAPSELPMGVISGLIGGPFFFALLWRDRAAYRL
ncbi:MAG: iron ABC transporter permease [Chloroflexi bacterium]|nr:iron ABC transporter permease [Chloroflexota bacterium]